MRSLQNSKRGTYQLMYSMLSYLSWRPPFISSSSGGQVENAATTSDPNQLKIMILEQTSEDIFHPSHWTAPPNQSSTSSQGDDTKTFVEHGE